MSTRLREIIKEHGLTITQSAKMIDMTRANLNRYIDTPSISLLERFSKVLQVPMWQFFATREDVLNEKPKPTDFTCPKCGAKLEITIKEKQH